MKYVVLQALEDRLAAAQDNLNRANARFMHMGEEELNQQYGESGVTCREILKDYWEEVEKWKRAVAWVNWLDSR